MSNLRDHLWRIAREAASSGGVTFAGGCEHHLDALIERLAADIGADAERVPLAESYVKALVADMMRIAKARGMDQLHEPTFFEAVTTQGDPVSRTRIFRGAARRRTRSSSAIPPPPPPPAKKNGGGRSGSDSAHKPAADDPPRTAFALVECPPVVVAGVEFDVRIGLSAEQSAGIVGGPLVRPPSSVGPYTLTVQVVADGCVLRANEAWRNTLQVTAEAPYPTLTLHLTPAEQVEDLRPGAIQAIYSVDGHTMGFAVRSIVTVRRAELRPREVPPQTVSGTDLSIPTQLTPPDLTVRISTNTKESGGLLWTFETRFPDIDLPDEAAKTNIGDQPQLFAQQLVAQLNRKEGQPDLAPYLHLSPGAPGESQLAGVLLLSREFLHRFTSGVDRKPGFNAEFPARLIRTDLDWHDLVLPAATLAELDEIRQWVLHGRTLLHDWDMRHKLRPGFTSLFFGQPGTGKTLSACLLGKHCGCDVYKVDLSMIVSKYIGETEKNLSKIFDVAEHKGWILFFDEADALFGKRTRVDDSHDRYANQEISFLLQRIEEFDGVAILASNFKSNIDDAFVRRFESIVHFPMPKPPERLRIWREAFPRQATLDARIDLGRISEKYDLSGGTIMNVVRYASIMALSRGGDTIDLDDLEEGVRREFMKEGRAL